jgi:hypothetical protein
MRRLASGRRTAAVAATLMMLGTLGGPGLVSSSVAAPKADCTDYGSVPEAPKGSIPRDDHIIVKKDPLASWRAGNRAAAREARVAADTTVVPVVFHVIRKGASLAKGNLTNDQIDAQIDVLNDAFAPSGFSFDLQEVTRTTKESWFNLVSANGAEPRYYRGSGKEVKMKKALHQGDSRTLNIYSASLAQSLLGWAYLPWDFTGESGDPLPRFYDGVVVDFRSLPIGDLAYDVYGEGDTGTHEVGHWLGLFHTFDGGCEGGDFVEDTAPEASPAFGCPEGRDTCEEPGLDPITNFMDYTWDSCMNHFTPGQADRMNDSWTAYRA